MDKFNETTSYMLHQLVMCMDHEADKALSAELGISYSQFLIMLIIDQKPEVSQKDISAFLMNTEAAISRQVEKLRSMSYLTRITDTNNRRRNILKLTEQGLEIISKAKKLLDIEAENWFSVLKPDEYKNFQIILKKLVSGVVRSST